MTNTTARMLATVALAIAALGGGYSAAQDTTAAAVKIDPAMAAQATASIERARTLLDGYLRATDSLRASFSQILLDDRGLPVAESSGVVMVKRPQRFRWEYSKPVASLILADGKRLWNYDAELEQAVARNLEDIQGANPSNLLGGDAQIDEDFEVLGAYSSGDIEWVELAPRGQTADFTKIRLGFDADRITLMELHTQLGQTTRILLSDVETNADIADSVFVFVPPPGVDVVGGD